MRYLIVILILLVILIAGCTQQSQTQPVQKQPIQTKSNQSNQTNQSSSAMVCNPPQIKLGTGCCMDINNNSICDTNEDEKCLNVFCDDFYCSGKTLYYNGRCVSGMCQFLSMTCSDTCMNDRCVTFNPLYSNRSFGINANWTVGSNTIFVEFTNTGINSIDMTQVMAYLDDKYANITFGNTGILASGDSKTLNITMKTPMCNNMILILLASGQSQSGTVHCFAKGFGKIQVTSPWSIAASNGAMRLNILNKVGGEINVTGAKMGSTIYNASQTLAPEESAIIQFVTSKWIIKKPGSSYSTALTVYYNYNGSAFSSSGTLSGTYF